MARWREAAEKSRDDGERIAMERHRDATRGR